MAMNDSELSALTQRVRRSLDEIEAASQRPHLTPIPPSELPIVLPPELHGKWNNWTEFLKALEEALYKQPSTPFSVGLR